MAGPIVDIAILAALPIEIDPLLCHLQDTRSLQASGFQVRLGKLSGKNVAVVTTGPGMRRAALATQAVLQTHKPRIVLSAGFAGGLHPGLVKYALFTSSLVITAKGEEIPLAKFPSSLVAAPKDLSTAASLANPQTSVHESALLLMERLLTAHHVVGSLRQKESLRAEHRADAIDMETFAVAEVCQQFGTPCFSLRVVSDACNEELPPELSALLEQHTLPGQFGAIAATLWRKPSRLKELLQLRTTAMNAAKILAKPLRHCVESLS